MVLKVWCTEHLLHNMVKRQLKRLGNGWWSVLAQTIHLWRQRPHAMRSALANRTSQATADEVVKRLPQRPLKGRWGSCSASVAASMAFPSREDFIETYDVAVVQAHHVKKRISKQTQLQWLAMVMVGIWEIWDMHRGTYGRTSMWSRHQGGCLIRLGG